LALGDETFAVNERGDAMTLKSRLKSLAFILFSAVGLLAVSVPALAHHGFAGRYDEEHPYTVQGTVLEFQFVNPHSAIIFESKEKDGSVQRWHAELGGSNALHRADGWDRDTLKPGDKITVIGPRNKNGSNDMNLSHESKIILTDSGKEIHNSFKSAQNTQ
jgi:hypothetical protein